MIWKNNIIAVAAILSFFLFSSGAVFAETIFLKDGRKLEGEIISRSRDTLLISTKDGKIIIRKDEVMKTDSPTLGDLFVNDSKSDEKREADTSQKSAEKVQPPARTSIGSVASPEFEEQTESPPLLPVALFQSTVLPGWGQFYQHREISGYIFFTSFGLLGLNQIRLEIESQQKKTDYNDQAEELYAKFIAPTLLNTESIYPLEFIWYQYALLLSAKKTYSKSISSVNNSASLLLGVYVANLVDVALFHPGHHSYASMSISPDGVGLKVTWNF